ncbi:type II secretion system protein GspD [Azospirillum endophyticum]
MREMTAVRKSGFPMHALLGLLAAGSLAGCSLPEVGELPKRETVVAAAEQRLTEDNSPAVTEVPVGQGMLVAQSLRQPLPASLATRRISVSFPSGENTLDRLTSMMTYSGVPVATRFEGTDGAAMLRQTLPIRAFTGSFVDLAGVLETGMGVVAWWQNGTLFLSDRDRFAFTVPQNQAVIDSVMTDLKTLGATDITQSLRGGQVVFSASPTVYREVIQPYIDRLHRNMAMVRIQLAVVSLGLTDQSASGFDWNALALQFNRLQSGTTTTTTGTTVNGTLGNTLSAGQAPVSVNIASPGTLLGVSGVFNVAGAISFLSKFGNTDTRQNVEVHTLSGAEVTLRSGQTIPYVTGVGVTAVGGLGAATTATGTAALNSPGVVGSAQTGTVQTGLTIKLTPHFDADNQIVTIDLNLLLNNLIEFRDLNAGNQVGILTQPVTQEQALNDIVRVVAGNTVVLGGLQTDSRGFSGNQPTVTRGVIDKGVIGKQAQDISKDALFLILRPTVTVFRPAAR